MILPRTHIERPTCQQRKNAQLVTTMQQTCSESSDFKLVLRRLCANERSGDQSANKKSIKIFSQDCERKERHAEGIGGKG